MKVKEKLLTLFQKLKFKIMIDYVLEYEIEKLENWLDDLKNEPPTNILLAQRRLRKVKEVVPNCIYGLPEADIYSVEKRNKLIREIEEKISEYRLLERRKRKNIRIENMQPYNESYTSKNHAVNVRKTNKGKSKPFIDCVIRDDKRIMEVLHAAMKNKRGKGAALIIRAAINNGWIERPSSKAVADEFGDIGHRSGFNKYMDDKYKFSEVELNGAKAQLVL